MAHNIIEQLHKPITVGPEIWTIKVPALQAEEIGLLKVVKDPAELTNNPSFFKNCTANKISRNKFEWFLKLCSGQAKRRYRCLKAKDEFS